MAEAKASLPIGSRGGVPSAIENFKEYLELQATTLEMGGFMQEAGNLRRWVAELARKSSADLASNSKISPL